MGLSPNFVSSALIIFVLWVVACWIIELTIVVFIIQVLFNSVGNSEEVGHVLAVGEVLVKVILEVLKHVHVLLDESVSSNSWEGEGGVIELPGVDLEFWGKVLLLLESLEVNILLIDRLFHSLVKLRGFIVND